jgi:8-amino-7-oxononanoate synthase
MATPDVSLVFSMQMEGYRTPYEAELIVDEAHAVGVLGPAGSGLCAELGVTPDAFVGTFGKAFGCSGAFVAGSAELVRYLESRAAPFIYTTAPPPATAAAASAALSLVENADEARARLLALAQELRVALERTGVATFLSGPKAQRSERHIIPAFVPGVKEVVDVSTELFRRGVFVQALRPPTVPPGTERLRWTPTSRHTSEQIERAVTLFTEVLRDLDVA